MRPSDRRSRWEEVDLSMDARKGGCGQALSIRIIKRLSDSSSRDLMFALKSVDLWLDVCFEIKPNFQPPSHIHLGD